MLSGLDPWRVQYIAGFFDGDGWVGIPKIRTATAPHAKIGICQSCDSGPPPELLDISNAYPGRLWGKKKKKLALRRSWILNIRPNSRIQFLVEVADAAIVKRDQLDWAGYYELRGRHHHSKYRALLRKAKDDYTDVLIDDWRLTIPYIAGLFAAEGSLGIYPRHRGRFRSLQVVLTQTGCPRLMHAIRKKIGYGSVHGGRLILACRMAARFLEMIQPYVRGQKKKQIKLALEFQKGVRPGGQGKRTEKELRRADKIAKKIEKLKKT